MNINKSNNIKKTICSGNNNIQDKHSWWKYELIPTTILWVNFIEGYINASETVKVQARNENSKIVERDATWYKKAGIFGGMNAKIK